MMGESLFQTRGPILDHTSSFYIGRAEDDRLLQHIRRGEYVTLLGPRQTGKTSLLLKVAAWAKEDCVPILVSIADYQYEPEEQWYRYVGSDILVQFQSSVGDVELPQLPHNHLALRLDFVPTLNKQTERPIIMMLDEIGTLPTGVADRFLGVIRAMSYSNHFRSKGFVFVLAGATDPNDLVSRDNPNSPLNTTHPVYTQPLDRVGFLKLTGNLARAGVTMDEQGLEMVYQYTGGHVNLTQKICALLTEAGRSSFDIEDVESLIQGFMRSGDENLRHVCRVLDTDAELRRFSVEVLNGCARRFDRTNGLVAKAELLGILMDRGGRCDISNRIYRGLLNSYLGDSEERIDRETAIDHRQVLLGELQARNRNLHKLRMQLTVYAAGEEPLHLLNKVEAEEAALRAVQRILDGLP